MKSLSDYPTLSFCLWQKVVIKINISNFLDTHSSQLQVQKIILVCREIFFDRTIYNPYKHSFKCFIKELKLTKLSSLYIVLNMALFFCVMQNFSFIFSEIPNEISRYYKNI